MSNFELSDWRKQAAAVAVSDADIEKAFADQAAGFVENKLGDLASDDYMIGFEVVRKNDDNTKMVGVFAYKIEDKLIFAPVFFLNGEIKGPLLYRCDTRTFVPATKEWASYLIEAIEMSEGEGVPKTYRSMSAPLVQMQRMTFAPAGFGKRASSPVNVPVCECPIKYDADGNPVVALGEKGKDVQRGDAFIKMEAEDDGTLRLEAPAGRFFFTKDMAKGVGTTEPKEPIVVHIPELDTFKITVPGVKLIKKAFFDNVPNYIESWADDALDVVEKFYSQKGTIKDLLASPEYGQAAGEAIVKAASESFSFAEKLADIYGSPANLFPKSYAPVEKKATVMNPMGESVLELFTEPKMSYDEEQRKKFYRDGFLFVDNRDKGALSLVYSAPEIDLSEIQKRGIYNIMLNDGTFVENVAAAPYNTADQLFGDRKDDYIIQENDVWKPSLDKYPGSCEVLAIKDKKIIYKKGMVGWKTNKYVKSAYSDVSINAGNAYFLLIENFLYGPFAVVNAKVQDGVLFLKMQEYSISNATDSSEYVRVFPERQHDVIWNNSLEKSSPSEFVLGNDAIAIPVDMYAREYNANGGATYRSANSYLTRGNAMPFYVKTFGNAATFKDVDAFISGRWGAKRVDVLKKEINKKANYIVSDGVNVSPIWTKAQLMTKMARDMAIPADVAYVLVDHADKNNSVSFYVHPQLEKVATRLHIVDSPIFEEDVDSELGIPSQDVQRFALKVQGDQMYEPPSSVGDASNPTSLTGLPNGIVVSTSADALRDLADTYHLPNVFEHGVVATLADTFDSFPLIKKYIPKLEEAVDALGRIKFLLYWRPSDFEKMYGVDAMVNLESEIDSNFEALGSILLKFLKKMEPSTNNNTSAPKN